MPAKKQVSQEKIFSTALELFRESGMDAVNLKSLTKKLGCSSQPLYLSFSGIDQLKDALTAEIRERYAAYMRHEIAAGTYSTYQATAMAYIRFAQEEKEMFRFLFLRPRTSAEMAVADDAAASAIAALRKNFSMSYDEALCFHAKQWIYAHGMATALATSYYTWDEETIAEYVNEHYSLLLEKFQRGKKQCKKA